MSFNREDEAASATYSFSYVTPSVTVLSETSVRLSWPSASGVVSYDIFTSSSTAVDPIAGGQFVKRVSGSATQTTLDAITPGSVGNVIVRASVTESLGSNGAPARYWTPYGAVNEPSVNSISWLGGTTGQSYAEGFYFSANFSIYYVNAYAAEISGVFDHVPSGTEAPLFNCASPWIKHPNGFDIGSYTTDVSQIWSDGLGKVAIAQSNQGNRVLIYNHLPLSAATATPDLILGQTTWTGRLGNAGGVVGNVGMAQPTGVCFNGTHFYVADKLNNRVLAWVGWPTDMGQPANFVLGQQTMAGSGANAGGRTKYSLSAPNALSCYGGKLAIADGSNHRVVIYDPAPSQGYWSGTIPAAGDPTVVVLGQANPTLGAANGAGGFAVGGLNGPSGVAMMANGVNTAVLVTDWSNNRVAQWDSIPGADGAPINRVYGQPNVGSNTANNGGVLLSTMKTPQTIAVEKDNEGADTSYFWVADWGNGRYLRFFLNNPTAVDLYGQRAGNVLEYLPGSYTSTHFPASHYTWGKVFLDPLSGIFSTGGGQFWNTPPESGLVPASAVQGRSDMTSAWNNLEVTSPTSAIADGAAVRVGSRVFFSDVKAKRVLSADTGTGYFTSNNLTADHVLGSKDLNGTVVTEEVDFAFKFSNPTQLLTYDNGDGTSRLLCLDGSRIAVWNPVPAVSNAAITYAIGQPNTLTNAANQGGISAATLSSPGQMVIVGTKLIVADSQNHRVLIWNTLPVASGMGADVVLGQTAPNTAVTGTDLNQMNVPVGVAVLNGKLIVSDYGNKRLLIWDGIPAVTGTAANRSFDLRTMTFSLPAWYNADQNVAKMLQAYNGRLYLGLMNGRALVVPDFFSP